MRKLKFTFGLFLVALLFISNASATEFNRRCSVTGGSAQRLSTVLQACGYTGANTVQELTITNPDDASNDIYVGQSDVSASNGFRYHPGDSRHRLASDPTTLFLFVSSTQDIFVSVGTQ